MLNSNLIHIEKPAILVQVLTPKERKLEEEHGEELLHLSEVAGYKVTTVIKQRITAPRPPYYIGKGKLEEVKDLVHLNKAQTVIFGVNTLSPSFKNKLEDFLKTEVVDRTQLTLSIFELHASSKESKIQIELARLRYELPRLRGRGEELSRLGGGIATRGPGEMEIEKERRIIRKRINFLEKTIESIMRNRKTLGQPRKRQGLKLVAILGYTNAGKTSLFNLLTKSQFEVAPRAFTTLDPRIRFGYLGNEIGVIFSDTVGFIRDLPLELFTAFKATLEEAKEADYLLLVVDISQSSIEEHLSAIYKTLNDLGIQDKPSVLIANKVDLLENPEVSIAKLKMIYNDDVIGTSTETYFGIDDVKSLLRKKLQHEKLFTYKS